MYSINLNTIIVKTKWRELFCRFSISKLIEAKSGETRSTDYGLQRLSVELQPADISWNRPYKEAYRKKDDEWLATGEHSFTPAGNMRPPSKKLVATRVKQAWDAVSSEVIINSFRVSGIALNPNGLEDKEIRCLREGEVAAAAKEDIRRQSATLAQRDDDEDPLSFAGLSEDEEEPEINELIVEDDAESDLN